MLLELHLVQALHFEPNVFAKVSQLLRLRSQMECSRGLITH